jgi:uncharacterized protein YbbC (DUF1343 family)
VQKDKQYRPAVTEADLWEILSTFKKRKYGVLFAILACTGLQIGEALVLCLTDFGPDCRVLHVRRSLWRRQSKSQKRPMPFA